MSRHRIRTMWHEEAAGEAGPFNGTMYFQAPVIYKDGKFQLEKVWNEECSYGSKLGVTNGSTYFSGNQTSAITISHSGNIYAPPTRVQAQNLFSGNTRAGATYNGTSGAKYATVQLTDAGYAGLSNAKGTIFFPDSVNVSGPSLSLNSVTAVTNITVAQLTKLIKQKCLFLPYCGYVYANQWRSDVGGEYLTKTFYGTQTQYVYYIVLAYGNQHYISYQACNGYSCMLYLCRDA